VDNTGVVLMETHESPITEVERIEGVQYEQGCVLDHFITNKEDKTCELHKPLILILDSKIDNIRKIQNVLEYIISEKKSLLIIGELDPQVTSALAMNKVKGNIKVNVINSPVYGINRKEMLEDLSLITGATVVNEDLGDDMDLIDLSLLGSCKKTISSISETLIQVDEMPTEVNDLINFLRKKIIKEKNSLVKEKIERRIARLLAKVAVIKVGANSEIELKEKKDRVEDAICATKAAIKEGIVPGGGIALLNAATNINADNSSEEILFNAIKSPYNTILNNAGITDYTNSNVEGEGLNVVTGKTVSMVKSGIIDPLLVTKSALRNAASVASTILSTDCVINNLRA